MSPKLSKTQIKSHKLFSKFFQNDTPSFFKQKLKRRPNIFENKMG